MTEHTMPMLTDSDREELIAEIEYNRVNCFLSSKTKLLMQIAEAALNAKPAGNFTYHEDEDGDLTDFIVESDGFAKNSFKLYTAPPVPAIKPIELPDLRQMVSGERYVWGDGVFNYKQDVINAIRAAGYEVKE